MFISRTAEYALRAMLHLASTESDEAAQTVEQMAATTLVPATYLAKVLQKLARGGLIVSQRGFAGGFRLAKAAQEISIYEVVNAVDPIERIEKCPLGLEAHGMNLCPLHARMDALILSVEEQMRATKLVELLDAQTKTARLDSLNGQCSFPCR